MFSLIRLVLFTRWGRYIIAAILLIAALGSGLAAFAVTHIQMKSGTIAALGDVVDSQTTITSIANSPWQATAPPTSLIAPTLRLSLPIKRSPRVGR